MIPVAMVRMTCPASPSQWEGATADGRKVYVRYRWGMLRIGLGATFQEAVADHQTFHVVLGDSLHGHLTYAQLIAATVGIFEWPAEDAG